MTAPLVPWISVGERRLASGCADCGCEECRCYALGTGSSDLLGDRLLVRAPEPDEPVVLERRESSIEGGLEIAGIATTAGWGAWPAPIVPERDAFLLQEKNERRIWGLIPKAYRGSVHLPAPLLWHHGRQRLGDVFEFSADSRAVYFRAIVAPPGYKGLDGELLERIWRGIESHGLDSVSLSLHPCTDADGSWAPAELSIVLKGANPAARITEARYPDGTRHAWGAPSWSDEEIRDASEAHYRAAQALVKRSREEKTRGKGSLEIEALRALVESLRSQVADLEDGAVRFKGVWSPAVTYRLGDTVMRDGSSWVLRADSSRGDEPGKGGSWAVLAMRGRDGRDRR